jgi:2-desacetyl-2-hydroxyethyl bacteriochlorophyllide A dehydrogenase
MIALRKTEVAFGLSLHDIPSPHSPGPGEVLVAVDATGICGSDVHIYEWTGGYEFIIPTLPVTLGHEIAGRIAATGPGVGSPPLGAQVIVVPSVTCGVCAACASGNPDACLDRRGIGMTRDGGFASHVLAPARNCILLPDNFDPAIAALCEPMVIGARAVEVGGVKPGDHVLIMGPGTIGQTIALMAREAGATGIVITGLDDAPRLGVVGALGFDAAIDLSIHKLPAEKFDIVFEATGVPQVVQQGLSRLRREGVLVVAGIHPAPACIDLNTLVREQLQLRGTQRGKQRNWRHAADFVIRNGVALAPMVTHQVSLSRVLEGFDLARARIAAKVMVRP